jgi:hypothetical protein
LPDLHPDLTLFLTLWAAVGPLVGLAVGYYFHTRERRKRRRCELRRAECCELLSQLAVMYIAVSDWNNGPVEDAPNNALRYDEAIVEFHRLLGNQPLVADEIREAKFTAKWNATITKYVAEGGDGMLFAEYKELRDAIVQIGLRS